MAGKDLIFNIFCLLPGVDRAQVELCIRSRAAGTTPKGSVIHNAVHRAIGKCADFIKRHRVHLQPQQQETQTTTHPLVLLQG